ncbi:MAG: regulatory protein RecX [Candidatus Omnitrophica bacterium]|nr:regulatory protein RecX [Candidatus Omnitrophota bacterium]
MDNKKTETLQKARAYAFLLLKYRLRSEKELGERLKRKKFDEATVKETLAFLKEKDFIDDKVFARAWIDSRLRKPLGLRKIKQELKLKGINPEIADKIFDSLKQDYSEKDTVGKIFKDRFTRLKNIEPLKAKRRIYTYLLRRGFSGEAIIEAMHKL